MVPWNDSTRGSDHVKLLLLLQQDLLHLLGSDNIYLYESVEHLYKSPVTTGSDTVYLHRDQNCRFRQLCLLSQTLRCLAPQNCPKQQMWTWKVQPLNYERLHVQLHLQRVWASQRIFTHLSVTQFLFEQVSWWCNCMLTVKCVLTIRVYGASFFCPLSSAGGAVDCPGWAGVSVAAVAGPVGDVSTKTSSVTRKRISSPWSM